MGTPILKFPHPVLFSYLYKNMKKILKTLVIILSILGGKK